MESLLSLDNLLTLMVLILLQAVLGFDNLLYISLEANRVKPESRSMVRKLGIGIAVLLRIALLFTLLSLIQFFQDPLFSIQLPKIIEGTFNLHSIIVLLGGVFLLYTAMKEIWHMMSLEDIEMEAKGSQPIIKTIVLIVTMNAVFSFDSILSAMALTNEFILMATAIIIGGILMVWLADRVSEFLKKNRMYEVLGLFILFLVGALLLSEGGHLSDLHIAGQEITAMSKATFYFVLGMLILTEIVQSRYQGSLVRMKEKRQALESSRAAGSNG